MKRLFIITFITGCCYYFTCCSGGKSSATAENLVAGNTSVPAIPPCIQQMIDSAKKQVQGMGITEIRRYIYNGAKVYLVTAPCCDQYNPLYDSACHFLFAPSGGFTGKGDRTNTDFFTQAKEDSLIWKSDK